MMLLLRIFIVAVGIFLWGLCQNVWAVDNGVIKLEIPDAAAVGMGGAFTGQADRPSAVYYNPAGITQMVSASVSAGVTFLQPQIEYKSTGGDTVEMNRDNYLFPHVYVTTPIIPNKFYIGIGENSDFGAGNDWSGKGPSTFTQAYLVKDSFTNQDYMLVGAYKFNDQWSLGAGAIDDQSEVENYKLINQYDGNPANALFKANDNAWGFTLATLFKLNDQNQFGLTYKSPIQHTYDGKAYLNNLDNTVDLFGPYGGFQGLYGGTNFATKAVMKFTLPQSVTLGYDLKPTKKWIVNFDLEWTDWSRTQNQTVSFPNLSGEQAAVLSAGNPPISRDWTSDWSESIGAQYSLTDSFRLRVGYVHHQTPVPENTYDTEFPDSNSNSYTAGFGYDVTKNITLDMAYVAVFYESRSVTNSQGAPPPATLDGKYKEFVNIGTATLTYKF